MSANSPHADQPTRVECSYEAFGREFLRHAVTRERIENALADLAGDTVDFGPKSAGPGGLARIAADGAIGDVTVTPLDGDLIRFDVRIPVELELKVGLAGQTHRFEAALSAPLQLTARTLEDVRIFIDVTPPSAADVHVDMQARGLGASVLNVVADVEGELRRTVARFIAREIDKPAIRDMREIDIAARLDKAFSRG